MTNPEYQRGYRAGRKRTEAEISQSNAAVDVMNMQARDRWTAVFCTALQEVMRSGTWQLDSQNVRTVEDHIRLATIFANKAPGTRQ